MNDINPETVIETLKDLERATVEGAVAEMRKVVRGKAGYQTLWPSTRKKRGVARRNPPSIGTFKFRPERGYRRVLISNTQRHAVLLEQRPTIRGYPNKHFQALKKTLELNDQAIQHAAQTDALRRARGRAVRRSHAQQASRQRATGANV